MFGDMPPVLPAMLSENASLVKRSLLVRWRGIMHYLSADDRHADGKIFDSVLWNRQQILL
jgi:hypothetical protein